MSNDMYIPGCERVNLRGPSSAAASHANLPSWMQRMKELQAQARLQNNIARVRQRELEAAVEDFAKTLPDALEAAPWIRGLASWSALPHSCPACVCTFTSSDSCKRAAMAKQAADPSELPLEHLAKLWRQRHDGILGGQADEDIAAVTQQKLCLRRGMCLCRGEGRLVALLWNNAQQCVKRAFRADLHKDLLKSGLVCLRWLPSSPDPQRELDEAELHKFTFVAYHSFKPWDPTFLSLQHSARDVGDGWFALSVVVRNNMPHFTHPHMFIGAELDLELQWSLQILRLSTRKQPFAVSHGLVCAQPAPSHPHCHVIWRGRLAETRRLRMHGRRRDAQPAQNVGAEAAEQPLDLVEGDPDGAVAEVMADPDFDARSESQFDPELELLWGEVAEQLGGAEQNSEIGSEASSESEEEPDPAQHLPEDDPAEAAPAQAAPLDADNAAIRGEDGPGGADVRSNSSSDSSNHRNQHEFTHNWGRGFRMVFRPPRAFQAVCRYHDRHARTKCTKTLTCRSASEEDRAHTLKRLQLWCLAAPLHANRSGHMGGRGLRAASDQDLLLSADELLARERLLPPPPP